VSTDLRVIANTPSLDNQQIAANGQFTTNPPQRTATLMTSGQVTVPRDRLGITAREVKASIDEPATSVITLSPTSRAAENLDARDLSPVHTSNSVEATGNKVASWCCLSLGVWSHWTDWRSEITVYRTVQASC